MLHAKDSTRGLPIRRRDYKLINENIESSADDGLIGCAGGIPPGGDDARCYVGLVRDVAKYDICLVFVAGIRCLGSLASSP